MKHLDDRSPHPSFLELDRHALGAARTDVAAHLAGCESCRARLASPGPAPKVVPSWARELGPRRRSGFSWPALTRLRAVGFSVTALACALLIWTVGGRSSRPGGPESYVGTKGSPGLWLYLKRGERVALWNGSDPVLPGDLLRLKVQPDRFKHMSVFEAAATAGTYERLYDADIASGQLTAVPVSWKVDARPGAEILVVVLAEESVAASQVAGVLARDQDGRHWSRRLVLVKATGPDGARRDGSAP